MDNLVLLNKDRKHHVATETLLLLGGRINQLVGAKPGVSNILDFDVEIEVTHGQFVSIKETLNVEQLVILKCEFLKSLEEAKDE